MTSEPPDQCPYCDSRWVATINGKRGYSCGYEDGSKYRPVVCLMRTRSPGTEPQPVQEVTGIIGPDGIGYGFGANRIIAPAPSRQVVDIDALQKMYAAIHVSRLAGAGFVLGDVSCQKVYECLKALPALLAEIRESRQRIRDLERSVSTDGVRMGLVETVRKQREEIERWKSKMRCVECEGRFDLSELLPATSDPESPPICKRCLRLAASQERERALREILKSLDCPFCHWDDKRIEAALSANRPPPSQPSRESLLMEPRQ